MGVVPTKGQVALGDHLPPESPPTSPLHVRTVGACVALSNIRCFSCLFQCFVILFFKCRALNYLSWFCMLLSIFVCVLLIVFVFSSIVVFFRRYWVFLYFHPWFCVFPCFCIFYPVVLYSPPWLSIFHLLKAVAPVFTQRSHLDTECKSECRKILKKINTLVYNWSKMECPLDAFAYLETNKKTCCAFSVPDCFACINPTCVLCISICALSPALECIREKDTNISASCQSA